MYGFVLWKNNPSKDEDDFVNNFITIHRTFNPFKDLGEQYRNQRINDFNLIYFLPKDKDAVPLIQQYDSEVQWILFWGQLFNTKENCAQVVYNKLKNDESIENLNGNYSFILYNKKLDTIKIYTDFMGRRKLYFFHNKDEFAVSNLDHLLVPFLPKLIEYDFVSIASSLYFDWSLMGKSYLKFVGNLNPDNFLLFENKIIKFVKIPYNLHKNKVSIKGIYNDFHSYLENYIKGKETVHIDLTAGLDTRTILALLLKGFKKNIIAWTLGKEGMDFKVANRIAHHFEFKHKNSSPTFASLSDFECHSRFLAFCNNGDTNSLRAVDKIEIDYNVNIPKIIGIYGTISSGKNIIGNVQFKVYKDKMFANKKQISFISNDFLLMLKVRLFDYLDSLKSNYDQQYQELYYIRERCGNWGGVVFNSTWNLKHICPFEDINALQKVLSLPTEIRRKTKVQHDILLNHSKYLYLYPINQNPFNNGYLLFLPEKFRIFFKKSWDFLLSKKENLTNKNIQDISQQRTDIFFKYFKKVVKPILMKTDALSLLIMSDEDRKNLIYSFEKDRANILNIAQLYTMELWKEFINQMSKIKRD